MHIEFTQGKKLTGTARYVSVNTHLGLEQSRRDDLESIGYVLIYFLKGSLPWQGIAGKTKADKYSLIGRSKCSYTPDTLARGLPFEFQRYLQYCKDLKFDQKPDYPLLKNLFKELYSNTPEYVDNTSLDWNLVVQVYE